MAGTARPWSIARILLAAALVAAGLVAAGPSPEATAASLPRWTGGIDLYRAGTFTTQKTWLWCTAADVQIIRNIVDHRADHSRSGQQRYFDYMRAHNRYDIPVRDGVDPAGWAAGLRHFVDGRYRLVASRSFASALRSAVTSLRRTNLPVGITVSHGNHAWVLTGFTATADPATTARFTVTSVRVVGPLWGLKSTTYGYDMRPDRKLTPRQLEGFFTPWHYAGVRMAWEHRWVSVQPIATSSSAPTTRSTPAPAQLRASPSVEPSPTPTLAAVTSPAATAAGEPARSIDPTTADAGGVEPPASAGDASDSVTASSQSHSVNVDPALVAAAGGLLVLVAVTLTLLATVVLRAGSRR